MRLITRLVAWALGLALGLLALLFSIESRDTVSLAMWGVVGTLELPIYIAILGAWLIGFFCGALVMWFAEGKVRRLGRDYMVELHKVRAENADLQEQIAAQRQAADAAEIAANASASQPANANQSRALAVRAS